MFKNAYIFKIVQPLSLADIEATLQTAAFVPAGATQEQSVGWIPPRGQEHGALYETIAGHGFMKLMIETKSVPGEAIARALDEQVKKIEQTTGRKPGKKERRELKDEIRLSLLPMAFSKRSASLIWVNYQDGYIVVEASSQSKADTATFELVKSLDGLAIQMVNPQTSPGAAMAGWLVDSDNLPDDFTLDRKCDLMACDESKAKVKYANHPLDIEEIREHIAHGKMPTALALTWNDRVSFVLTEGMQLKSIAFLDVVFEDHYGGNSPDADHFDADMAITTGELSKMIPALIDALGGEVV
jgi:recombination associated protein RdgC